jgi:hypothetical protein
MATKKSRKYPRLDTSLWTPHFGHIDENTSIWTPQPGHLDSGTSTDLIRRTLSEPPRVSELRVHAFLIEYMANEKSTLPSRLI